MENIHPGEVPAFRHVRYRWLAERLRRLNIVYVNNMEHEQVAYILTCLIVYGCLSGENTGCIGF